MLRRRNAVVLLVAGLCAFTPRPGTGQLLVEISTGARAGTALVHDSIVTPFDVRPSLAPVLAVALAVPLDSSWAARVAVDFSSGEVQRHDADGSSVPLGRVSTAAFTVGLERTLPAGFSTWFGVGGLKYFPAEETGLFRLGSASVAGIGTLALAHTLPFGRRFGCAVELRYDIHAFTTPALRDEGFTSSQTVHRVALTVRAHGRAGQ